ncbi:MAG: hypothetical protein ACLQMF_06310 [Rectinemataceae bacterium]
MTVGLSELMQFLFPDLMRRMPLSAVRLLMMIAGSLYFAVNWRERRVIEENVEDMLGNGARSERTRREVFAHMFEHYFEKLLVANRPLPFVRAFVRERIECRGLGALDAALERGRGAIVVTAHWGAVELIPPLLVEKGYPISVILEARSRRLREALERAVVGAQAELIIASRGDRVLDKALDALARGRVLVTQVDEVDAWRRRPSRTIKLFGARLFFDHSLDFIAARSGAPSVGVFCRRRGMLRYLLSCDLLRADAPAGGRAGVSEAALKLWERHTMDVPEQWYQWKKWRSMKAPLQTMN